MFTLTQRVADLCHIPALNSYVLDFSSKQTSHLPSSHVREPLCNRVMEAQDDRVEVAFYPFLEANFFFSSCSLCCSSKLMEARFTSATCTLKTPAPTPASPRMRLAWTKTSLRSLWRTLHGKLVCISHDVRLCFYSGDNGPLNNLSSIVLIVDILWCDDGASAREIMWYYLYSPSPGLDCSCTLPSTQEVSSVSHILPHFRW